MELSITILFYFLVVLLLWVFLSFDIISSRMQPDNSKELFILEMLRDKKKKSKQDCINILRLREENVLDIGTRFGYILFTTMVTQLCFYLTLGREYQWILIPIFIISFSEIIALLFQRNNYWTFKMETYILITMFVFISYGLCNGIFNILILFAIYVLFLLNYRLIKSKVEEWL